jgi:hypothetical protein
LLFPSPPDLGTFFKDKADRLEDVNAGLFSANAATRQYFIIRCQFCSVGKTKMQQENYQVMLFPDSTIMNGRNFVIPKEKARRNYVHSGTNGGK